MVKAIGCRGASGPPLAILLVFATLLLVYTVPTVRANTRDSQSLPFSLEHLNLTVEWTTTASELTPINASGVGTVAYSPEQQYFLIPLMAHQQIWKMYMYPYHPGADKTQQALWRCEAMAQFDGVEAHSIVHFPLDHQNQPREFVFSEPKQDRIRQMVVNRDQSLSALKWIDGEEAYNNSFSDHARVLRAEGQVRGPTSLFVLTTVRHEASTAAGASAGLTERLFLLATNTKNNSVTMVPQSFAELTDDNLPNFVAVSYVVAPIAVGAISLDVVEKTVMLIVVGKESHATDSPARLAVCRYVPDSNKVIAPGWKVLSPDLSHSEWPSLLTSTLSPLYATIDSSVGGEGLLVTDPGGNNALRMLNLSVGVVDGNLSVQQQWYDVESERLPQQASGSLLTAVSLAPGVIAVPVTPEIENDAASRGAHGTLRLLLRDNYSAAELSNFGLGTAVPSGATPISSSSTTLVVIIAVSIVAILILVATVIVFVFGKSAESDDREVEPVPQTNPRSSGQQYNNNNHGPEEGLQMTSVVAGESGADHEATNEVTPHPLTTGETTSGGADQKPPPSTSGTSIIQGQSLLDAWADIEPTPETWRQGALLGRGASAEVRLGLDEGSGRIIAAKILDYSTEDRETAARSAQRLAREVRLMRQLSHPNLVQYLGCGRRGRTEFLIFMEYVPGGSLASVISQYGTPGLDPVLIAAYTAQILSGLMYLHGQEVVHRDLKGANILVDTSGDVKLADLGAATQIQDTITNNQQGTYNWMAPEVIREEPTGWPVDIWALGCTVIEMATGQPPFSELGTPYQVMMFIGVDTNPIRVHESITCPELRSFIEACVQRDPTQRPTAETLLSHPFLDLGRGSVARLPVLRPDDAGEVVQ